MANRVELTRHERPKEPGEIVSRWYFSGQTDSLEHMTDLPRVLELAAEKLDANFLLELDGNRMRLKENFEERWHYGWQPKDAGKPATGTFSIGNTLKGGPTVHFTAYYQPHWYVEVRTMDYGGPMSVTDGDKVFVGEVIKAINAAAKEVRNATS